MAPRCRVIVYDDDIKDAQHIATVIKKAFAAYDLVAEVEPITKRNELVPKLNTQPDLLICDVSLETGDDDITGLVLIENHKARFPHVAFAATTRNLELLQRFDQIQIGPDFLIPKALLFPRVDKMYQVQLINQILRHTRQNRSFTLHWTNEVEHELKEVLFKGEKFQKEVVDCLIRQVFSAGALIPGSAVDFQVSEGEIKFFPSVISHVDVTPLEKGRSGSSVFLAVPTIGTEKQEVAVVLKFSGINHHVQEVRNFQRYVKWTLPYSLRVDMLGVGQAGRFGLIGYSLAFAGSARARPLAKYMASGNLEPARKFVAQVFDEERKVWYRSPSLSEAEDDLVGAITSRLYGDSAKRAETVVAAMNCIYATEVFKLWSKTSGDSRLRFRKWLDRVLQKVWAPFQSCICHGDLHAGNVMMSEDSEGMVFIDFQDTGVHHVFTDFVFFENAVRKDGAYDWGPKRQFVASEKAEISGFLERKPSTIGLPAGPALVREIRTRAFKNFLGEEPAHYFVHELLFALKMMAGKGLEPNSAEKLTGFVIGCLEALTEFGGANGADAN